MNTFVRWWKFNLVGAMGMILQLAILGLLNRWAPGHYLYASAVAVELAVLHNFVWHLRFTWRDCRDSSTLFSQLMRFHLCNGLISISGTLVLMPILVHEARIPVLIANCISIFCCSIANFSLGASWVFATRA